MKHPISNYVEIIRGKGLWFDSGMNTIVDPLHYCIILYAVQMFQTACS